MHLINHASPDYSTIGLRLTDVFSALESLMPRVRRFTATATAGFDPGVRDPLGSYEEDAHCYGFGPACFLKLEPQGDLVKDIWFECRAEDPEKASALAARC